MIGLELKMINQSEFNMSNYTVIVKRIEIYEVTGVEANSEEVAVDKAEDLLEDSELNKHLYHNDSATESEVFED